MPPKKERNLQERLNELASEIARREGKKYEARIGEIREVLGILADLLASSPGAILTLLLYAVHRNPEPKP